MHNFKDILFIGLLILSLTYAVEYNIALNKVVTTSNNDYLATMVIDQDLNTYVQVYSGNNLGTWIQFDLKGVYNITKIIIWPTNDDNDYYLAQVYSFVRLTNNTAYDPNDIFCMYDRPIKGVSYNCSKNNNVVKGRYVLLKKVSSFTNDHLKIAEVAILTEDTDLIVSITGQVEQSHAFNNSTMYEASKAIDGDLYTCIFTAQHIHENRNIIGWWRTDLGDTYKLYAVNINDYKAEQQYRGYYSVYVDSGGFTKLQLCSFFNQSSTQSNSFIQLKCDSVLTGRYLTVERIKNVFRPDALTFCEIQIVAINKDPVYTLPTNYSGISRTSTTTKTLTPSSPTSPLISSSTTKTPSTSTVTISTSAADTCSDNYTDCQLKVQSQYQFQLLEKEKLINLLQTDKIVIGVVVGVLAIIAGLILGFVCGNVYQKKKSVKPTEATIYEKTKENKEQHIYSDLNITPMQEIDLYDNDSKIC